MPTQTPAPVLTFDPNRPRAKKRQPLSPAAVEATTKVDQFLRSKEAEEARAMGLTTMDQIAHARMIRDIEQGYQAGTASGRDALLSVLLSQFDEGYRMGCDDAECAWG